MTNRARQANFLEMRFDYQPPIHTTHSPRFRRLATLYITILGVGCICYAFLTYNINESQGKSFNSPQLFRNNQQNPSTSILELSSSGVQTAEPIIQAAANMQTPIENWRSVTIKTGDTLSKVFSNLGLSNSLLQEMINDHSLKKIITKLRPGQILDFKFDEYDALREVKLKLTDLKTLYIIHTQEGFKHYFEEQTPITKIKYSSGKIEESLYSAAHTAGLDDSMIMQMAEILGWDIDFAADIRTNDSFKILYEEEYINDTKLNPGKILAVEFVNNGKTYHAVRYIDAKGNEGYYSPEGHSLQKAFIRTPVKYTRISSHFSTNRRHPVLHKIRAHKGVDYAAPQGTPIKAAGDGKISFIGTKGGYGKAIEISHGQKYSTFYAHMSRFNNKFKHGSTVKQGEVIGYVGQTGLASGPHLHYEFRINGVHHNPVTVQLPRATPIAKHEQDEFNKHAANVLALLTTHERLAHRS